MAKVINLKDTINLSKDNPTSTKISIGMKWEMKEYADADLDVSVLVLNNEGKLIKEDSIVYYNNLKICNGAIQHSGDVYTAGVDSDDETIHINRRILPTDVKILLIIVTIFNKEGLTKVTFESIKNISLKLYDSKTNDSLCSFCLKGEGLNGTAIVVGRIELKIDEWTFTALCDVIANTHNGLQGVIDKYDSKIILDKKREKMMTMITPIRHRVMRMRWKKRNNGY